MRLTAQPTDARLGHFPGGPGEMARAARGAAAATPIVAPGHTQAAVLRRMRPAPRPVDAPEGPRVERLPG